ncbi:antitoxin Xre-like helix-turn-helix domain-containing protein [Sphingomonas melonis]|uniref:antitoxin Xre-like helix-turn-helix domain-containing protein n=1 Tax=Sphingomonas melonis TaxID=152682 RepID=UPI001F41815E|nr:antitoxin Xre-like helix-turn-helix domain-containing protein [Sphingomonas melonis]
MATALPSRDPDAPRVLSEAIARIATFWRLSNARLGAILGLSAPTVSRLRGAVIGWRRAASRSSWRSTCSACSARSTAGWGRTTRRRDHGWRRRTSIWARRRSS